MGNSPARRVVVTGIGIVSCLGNDPTTVTESLRFARSGLRAMPEYREVGLRSHVAGVPQIDLEARIDRRRRRFMGDAAAYAYVAMQDAIEDARLTQQQVSNPRTGLIAGSGGGSAANTVAAADLLRTKGLRRVGPYMVPRTMCSTVSACLATSFAIKGLNFSVTSACATSAHCISIAAQQIAAGHQDVIFAGGGEELDWNLTTVFDAMGALSTAFNGEPHRASRAYDAQRDGFVIAGGGGMLVLEALEHAQARGARIYAELIGHGATSDGVDMVAPSGEGAARCMRQALGTLAPGRRVDYVNTHGTSTPLGDVIEVQVLREVFGESVPPFSSTKSLSGHSLGAAGVHEAIYCLLMMQFGFIAGSANIDTLDEQLGNLPVVRSTQAAVLDVVASNSFGFGGTNATLLFERWRSATS